jgi:uncharacterized protein HemX
MPNLANPFRQGIPCTQTVMRLVAQVLRFVRLCVRSRIALAAEALFLRHQLTLYQACIPHVSTITNYFSTTW